jgi:hypothetical protein
MKRLKFEWRFFVVARLERGILVDDEWAVK